MQRVRLAAQLGSGLTGVLYVLDEPTIGLHPRDTGRLLGALRGLVDRGNSVLVVEHDADTIRAADHVIDVGPGGGKHGGRIVSQGALRKMKGSVTAAALERPPKVPAKRRPTRGASWLQLTGVSHHNLKNVDVRFPLERFVAITGVSGSGKSSLVREVLLRATREAVGMVNDAPAGDFDRVTGFDSLQRAIEIDQSPIGRTPRSVPATYIGVWNTVRQLLAGTPEARARGYTASRFSFNVEEGRCPECKGQGSIHVEMAFLPDVDVPCETCNGMRFTPETLSVRWQGLNAGELLELEVAEAVEVFSPVRTIRQPLELLDELGLGYLHLGQPSNTLSGGEAQRIKLVSELAAGLNTGPTLYVMDEPTTGLHRDDVDRLLGVLDRLVERGDTVAVIEHHPDVMLASDWIIDLGPEGGIHGGRVVAQGTPETIANRKRSHTAHVLTHELSRK
jgi:excinuclease ABC subunit A